MKKLALIMMLMLAVTSAVCAADGDPVQDVGKFQLQNTFIGFGVGSRHQGDTRTANLLLGLDITGTTLAVSGGVALGASIFVYNGMRAMVGEVTNADIWISAGVLGAGVVTLIVSKILGISMPLKY